MENDLKFSGDYPVTINFTGNADDIYAPVRGSSCDINIVHSHILDDLYSARKDEICVRINGEKPEMVQTVVINSQGTCEGAVITPDPTTGDFYHITDRNLLYRDYPARNLRFNGGITDDNGIVYRVNLLYDTTLNVWVEDNSWSLLIGDWYFDDNDYSYRVTNENGVHYVYEWDGSGWTGQTPYQKEENGTYTDCNYGVENIVHWGDIGIIEMVWGKETWGWDSGNKRWGSWNPYTDTDGSDYYSLYGYSYHRVKNSEGTLVDTLIVNGYEDDEVSNWVVEVHTAARTFTRMIPIDQRDLNQLFTDDSGNLYKIVNTGEIWFWSWTVNQWVKWIEFEGEGEFTANTFFFDYEIPSSSGKRIVVRYQNGSNLTRTIHLKITQAPTAEFGEEWTGNYVPDLLWEGYKMPNTYNQDVTLNLDTIEMTAIDPVSLMKYVTIDKLYAKPGIATFGELIGKAIAYVMLESHTLNIERGVIYGNSTYDGYNGLLDLTCQISNFWDESDEPSTVYDAIGEILKPFNMTLVFTGNKYVIYNSNKTTGTRTFDSYELDVEGAIKTVLGEVSETVGVYDIDNDWIPNKPQETSLEINTSYNSVKGVCSTSKPSYSRMVYDTIDYNQTDRYEKGFVNIQTNKSKGYEKVHRVVTIRPGTTRPATYIHPVLENRYYYIWNGVYLDPDYDLDTNNTPVDIPWYLNINKAKTYLDGSTGDPANYGSLLNFYGGEMNPKATGKSQATEKSVEIKRRITAFSPDNGTPLEFLEPEDIDWTYSNALSIQGPGLSKSDTSNVKWGHSEEYKGSNRRIYHQEYENVALSEVNDIVLDISMAQSFSRTGIDKRIDIMQNNTATNKVLSGVVLTSADSKYFPALWNSKNVKVNPVYFNRYTTGHDSCTPIWDETRFDIYVKLSDNTLQQFNGMAWVPDDGTHSNPFYLGRLMNNSDLYHNDFRYDCIRSSATSTSFNSGDKYTLAEEEITINYDQWNGVIDGKGNTTETIQPYKNQGFNCISRSSEGDISIKLPYVTDLAATIYVDVYNAGILGMTGNSTSPSANFSNEPFYYSLTQQESTSDFMEGKAWVTFLPINASYIKGEHVDLKISITVPDSNLGQMFSQSDIKYDMKGDDSLVEQFNGPTFNVNTFNELVGSSWSYILWGTDVADPGQFIINGMATRPEWYVIQAYYNWLTVVRKLYDSTIKMNDDTRMDNIMKFINTEISNNPMMIISDSWDLKSDRHSIKAIECHHLEVDYVRPINVAEIPRRARSDRFNLPTATRK